MKITFFGTSHGVPEANRRCSSTLIEIGNKRYFIDMGTQSVELLATRNMPIESINGIFITHMHGDHSNGLISFLDLCSWKFKTADPLIFLPEDVDEAKRAIGAWLKYNHVDMRDFKLKRVVEGTVYDDGEIKVTAYRTKHAEYSYAYLIEAEGKRVLFSGDLSYNGPSDDFPTSVLDQPLDLAVCEAAHFDATEYLPIFEAKKPTKLCFNHYSDKHLKSVLEVKERLVDVEVLRVLDGMEITV